MPLNLQGDFTPHIRWMAQSSTWRISGVDGHEPLEWKHAIFDLANIQTGWGIFAEGQAPEWSIDTDLSHSVAKPQDGREWRRGFKVLVFSERDFGGGGVREFATTAVGAVRGILDLYGQYEDAVGEHFGQVPVIEFTGATPTRIGKGNTSIPNFKIVKWVDRPATLPEKAPLTSYKDHQAPTNGKTEAAPDPGRPQREDYRKLDDEIPF